MRIIIQPMKVLSTGSVKFAENGESFARARGI
jgi:hypothetical protein